MASHLPAQSLCHVLVPAMLKRFRHVSYGQSYGNPKGRGSYIRSLVGPIMESLYPEYCPTIHNNTNNNPNNRNNSSNSNSNNTNIGGSSHEQGSKPNCPSGLEVDLCSSNGGRLHEIWAGEKVVGDLGRT